MYGVQFAGGQIVGSMSLARAYAKCRAHQQLVAVVRLDGTVKVFVK